VSVFSIDDRERVSDRVLELAASDERVIAGAVVGSLADDDGDRWSDLDLTFAVVDGVSLVMFCATGRTVSWRISGPFREASVNLYPGTCAPARARERAP
jgi:hypothetical protein